MHVYKIERSLDFTSERKRMSVIIKLNNLKRSARYKILCKGAPEVIK